MQLKTLFGKDRTRIFNLFFLDKNRDFTAAEVARELEIPHSTARERLRKLDAGEVLVFRKRGNLTLFRLNQKSPIFAELEKIMAFARQQEIQKNYSQNEVGGEKFEVEISDPKKEILYSSQNGKREVLRGGFSTLVRLKLER